MNVCNQQEQDFFMSHLNPDHSVLEWGSGESTLEIAPKVKKLVSIEDNILWYRRLSPAIPANTILECIPPNRLPSPDYDDGTYLDFRDYVDHPIKMKLPPFDIIFIDGRARVSCAARCQYLAHKDTLIFIHDYNHPEPKWRRPEYYAAEKYLQRLDGVFTMWKFKVKCN